MKHIYPSHSVSYFFFFTTLLLQVFTGNTINAQEVVNGGFEIEDQNQPHGWLTGDFGAGLSTTFSNSGNSSLAVWNWYTYVRGMAVNGLSEETSVSQGIIGYGTPLTEVPVALNGYYLYDTTNTVTVADSAQVTIFCKRYNDVTQSIDTIAHGKAGLPATAMDNGFVPFSVPVNVLVPNVSPDSIVIAFTSSSNGICDFTSDNCLYFYVDDLTLDVASGIIDISQLFRKVNIYPNPVFDNFTATGYPLGTSTIHIYDTYGRKLNEVAVKGESTILPSNDLTPGIYLVNFVEDGKVVAQKRILKK